MVKTRRIWTLLAPLLIVLGCVGDPLPRIVVNSEQAIISFPIDDRQEWSWNVEDSPTHSREYHWAARFHTESEDFEVAFSHFKQRDRTPSRGRLEELLRTGQKSAWILNPDGTASREPFVHIEARAENGRVDLVVDGPFDVERLFSEYPSTAQIRMSGPDGVVLQDTVPVRYDGEVGWEG